MENAKRILITKKEREIFIVRRGAAKQLFGFCGSCDSEVELLRLDDAATLSRIRTRELINQTEAGAIHSIETENGHLLVCRRSLEDFRKIEKLF